METSRRNGRKRSETDWQELIKRQRESGLTIGGFCDREGLTRSMFYKWQRQFRGVKGTKKMKPRFIELEERSRSSGWRMELDLGSGIVLRVRD